jgi:hypothetical protein
MGVAGSHFFPTMNSNNAVESCGQTGNRTERQPEITDSC